MKTVAIIQTRMGSTRLPGKVMKLLCEKTVLAHVIQRVRVCPILDEIVVATTTDPVDDIIIEEAERCGVAWFRGDQDDVLERYYMAARQISADVIVRITSDCPLFDPHVLSDLLQYFYYEHAKGKVDYASNTLTRSYPRGLDAEVFTFTALERAFREATKPYEHEHVTPFIYQHPEIFSLYEFKGENDMSHLRWTLDTPEDLMFIEEIYKELYRDGQVFYMDDVLTLLKRRPELLELNAHIEQKKL